MFIITFLDTMKKKLKAIYEFIKPFRMEDGKLITGAKNPRKTYNIVLLPKHLYFGGILFFVLIFMLFAGLYTNPYIEYKLAYECPNGTIEVYYDNIEYYCGVHKDNIEEYNLNNVDYINLSMIEVVHNETME